MMASGLQLPPPRKAAAAVAASAGAAQHPQAASPQSQKQEAAVNKEEEEKATTTTTTKNAPSYEERCAAAARAAQIPKGQQRPKLFVPRKISDFDDGGAFPELHVAQYPRHMGNPHRRNVKTTATTTAANHGGSSTSIVSSSNSRALVNVQVDKDGQVSYDAIVKGGTNADKIVYTKLDDMKEKAVNDNKNELALPTAEEEQEEAAKTQAALNALLSKKTVLDKPSGSAMVNAQTSQNIEEKTQFLSYSANPDAPGYNPTASKQRIIQMVPAQIDPMMPPKHKHVKAPPGPAEDPVPVLHAPPKKLTKEQKQQWQIPACISNWKNVRGYTIPLDKRLAADGVGLQDKSINSSGFAELSESLYLAEKQARQEVKLRATTQKQQLYQEKQQQEEELRKLAQQARLERGGAVGAAAAAAAPFEETIDRPPATSGKDHEEGSSSSSDSDSSSDDDSAKAPPPPAENEEMVAARQREKLRMERKRERERELRLEHNLEAKKKKKLEEERDVSEKIALGNFTGTGGGQDNVDSRLYSTSGGMDSGFGAEDEYNAYSKPLFQQQGGAGAGGGSIYRPTRGETTMDAEEQLDQLKAGATSKFQPHKGFQGAEGGVSGGASTSRTAPVQFEKADKK